MSAWKPGDVAMRVGRNGETSLAVCVDDCTNHAYGVHWHTFKDGRADWDTLIYSGITYRPLVVIDPEDREQVERLVHALGGDHYYGGVELLSAALREFVNPTPPKPKEPTGLGAVVEDAEGSKWTRADDTDCVKPWHRNGSYDDVEYIEINAVRVLSEGVTP